MGYASRSQAIADSLTNRSERIEAVERYEQVMAAHRAAYERGDTQEAQRLAMVVQAMRRADHARAQQAAQAPMPPDPGIAGAFGRFGSTTAPPNATSPSRAPVPAAAAANGLTPEQRRAIETAQARIAAEQRRQDFLARAPGATGSLAAQAQAELDRRRAEGASPPAAPGRAAADAPLIEVKLPNGTVLEFPAGTADDVMNGAIRRLIVEREAQQPGWSGLSAEGLAAVRRAQAPPIPGQGIPAGVDANAFGGPPENAGAIASLLTREGQAARPAATSPAQPPDLERIMTALRAAHAAGDTAAATRLAQMYREAQGAQGPRPALSGEALRAEIDANSVHRAGPLERFGTNLRDNLDGFLWDGDGDSGTIANRGEALAALLNRGGEAMTFGLIGDEADAAVQGAAAWAVPGGAGFADTYTPALAGNRAQETAIREAHPGLTLGAELGGALMGPGGPARFISRGVGALSRMGRGAAVGAGSGAIYGAAEAEGDAVPMEDGDFGGQSHVGGVMDRAVGGLLGAGIGGAGGAALTGIGQGFIRLAQSLRGQPGGQQAASTVEGLRDAAQRLYGEAEALGVVVPQDALSRLATAATGAVRGSGYHPRIHPRIAGVIEELQDLSGSPAGLGRLELARRVAGAAARSPEADERRLASLVIDRIDDVVEGLGAGSAPLRQARELWARMSRLGRIEGIMEDAANAKGSTEAAMATAFRTFLRNPRNLRGFSEAERHLMQQIARGSTGVRALRGLAHMLSLNSGQGLALTAAAAYQAGPIAGALPVAGYGARAIADALVRGQGNALAHLAGQSDQQRGIIAALLARPNALAGFTTAPTSQGILDYLGSR